MQAVGNLGYDSAQTAFFDTPMSLWTPQGGTYHCLIDNYWGNGDTFTNGSYHFGPQYQQPSGVDNPLMTGGGTHAHF